MWFKKGVALIASACVALSTLCAPVFAADETKLPAFPGAEGGGMWTTGARGGEAVEVYHVTTLQDDFGSKGTLRDAVSKSNRIIVFDVAGNIELKNALSIIGDNLTILGQTAPGDGICIKDNTVGVYGDNVILRYLRFRMGDACTVEDDSIGGRGLNNVIIDHCSMSWSVDETASFYENTNFTMQWCIISESLKRSVHAKENHGYAGIWGGTNTSFHHNLIAHHDSRNPRIATAGIDEAYTDVTKQIDLTDLRNNVIYNWGGNSAYGGENGAPVNLINCYYKPGPATSTKTRLFQISAKKEGDTTGTNSLNRPGWGTDLYVKGNYINNQSSVTNNNTSGVVLDSNAKKYGIWTDDNITEDERTVHFRYENDYPVTTQTAQDAYNSVLESAGASAARDAVDTRIIDNVKNGTVSYSAGKGIINSPNDVGGYPELTGTKAKDSDNDGISNEWEDLNGLDKFNKDDGLSVNPSTGYLYIEEYANDLADASYVRDTSYDPNVPDYDPSVDPDPDTDPTDSPAPDIELVSEWKAEKGDETKPAGTVFMPGFTNVIAFDRALTNAVNYPDGSTYNYAVTRKDGTDINGGWDLINKIAKGTAMKYVAPEDGLFTLYAYSVSGTKTFYVVPEGADDPINNHDQAIFAQEYVGSSVPIQCQVELEKGKTYYFFLDGSKARFCAARFEKYVKNADPYEISDISISADNISFSVTKNKESDSDNVAVVAIYDSRGMLENVEVKKIEQSLAVDASENFTVSAVPSAGGTVKVFVWDSLSGLIPLSAPAEKSK